MTDCDEGGEYDGMQDEPRYTMLAREAEMLFTGGYGLEKDPQRSGGARQTCPWAATGPGWEGHNFRSTGGYDKMIG